MYRVLENPVLHPTWHFLRVASSIFAENKGQVVEFWWRRVNSQVRNQSYICFTLYMITVTRIGGNIKVPFLPLDVSGGAFLQNRHWLGVRAVQWIIYQDEIPRNIKLRLCHLRKREISTFLRFQAIFMRVDISRGTMGDEDIVVCVVSVVVFSLKVEVMWCLV